MISRRTVLAGIVAAPAAAPAIVKAAIEPSASYASYALGRDFQVNGAVESAYLGSLANYDAALADWSKGDALRDVRALEPVASVILPADVLTESVLEYRNVDRVDLPPPSEPHDLALDSMYERD